MLPFAKLKLNLPNFIRKGLFFVKSIVLTIEMDII